MSDQQLDDLCTASGANGDNLVAQTIRAVMTDARATAASSDSHLKVSTCSTVEGTAFTRTSCKALTQAAEPVCWLYL